MGIITLSEGPTWSKNLLVLKCFISVITIVDQIHLSGLKITNLHWLEMIKSLVFKKSTDEMAGRYK